MAQDPMVDRTENVITWLQPQKLDAVNMRSFSRERVGLILQSRVTILQSCAIVLQSCTVVLQCERFYITSQHVYAEPVFIIASLRRTLRMNSPNISFCSSPVFPQYHLITIQIGL
jgi:hypothetical protein